MQDYARMHPRKYEKERYCKKFGMIRKLLLKGLPPEIVLILIMAIVFPTQLLPLIRK